MRPAALLRFAASWWCTAVLLLSLAGAYLALSLGGNPYPAWTGFVLHAPAGMMLCGALIINLSAATVRIVRERLRRPPVTEALLLSLDAHARICLPDDRAVQRAADWLRRRAAAASGGAGVRRITGTLSFLPGAVFRLGIALTLAALLISVHVRQTYDTVLREGGRRDLLGMPVELTALTADLPEDFLQVGEDGSFALQNVAARLTAAGRTATITPGFPVRIGGAWFRIVHLGYSQHLALAAAGKRTDRTVDLDVLPPGRTEILPLPPGDLFLTLSLEPERVIEKGLVKGRQYNLREPRFRIVVQRSRTGGPAHSGTLRSGGQAAIGPVQVALGERSRYIRLQIVRDAALPLLYAGMALLLAGLAALTSRFFWYEREFAAVLSDGELLIGCRDEFFRKWSAAKCQRWKDELEELVRE